MTKKELHDYQNLVGLCRGEARMRRWLCKYRRRDTGEKSARVVYAYTRKQAAFYFYNREYAKRNYSLQRVTLITA